jgi:hypothetical protein
LQYLIFIYLRSSEKKVILSDNPKSKDSLYDSIYILKYEI